MAQNIQRVLAAVGIVAHRRNHLRFGHDAVFDIERLLTDVSVIVDVGANEGQTALPFARAFDAAHVFAFEPVPETFANLTARTAREPRIECFNLALGAEEGDTTIRLAASSSHNSLLHVEEPGPGTVVVAVTTGDAWAAAHNIEHIDVLKIDTEGYELEVLEGFDGLIAAGRVEAVLAECAFECVTTEPHTSFFSLYEHLAKRNMGFATLYTDALLSNLFAWGNALFVLNRSPSDTRSPATSAAETTATTATGESPPQKPNTDRRVMPYESNLRSRATRCQRRVSSRIGLMGVDCSAPARDNLFRLLVTAGLADRRPCPES